MKKPWRRQIGPYRAPVYVTQKRDNLGNITDRLVVSLSKPAMRTLKEAHQFIHSWAGLDLINKFEKLLKEMGVKL